MCPDYILYSPSIQCQYNTAQGVCGVVNSKGIYNSYVKFTINKFKTTMTPVLYF